MTLLLYLTVLQDLELVTKSHFQCLQQLTTQGQLPIMQSSSQDRRAMTSQGHKGISDPHNHKAHSTSYQYKYHTGVI